MKITQELIDKSLKSFSTTIEQRSMSEAQQAMVALEEDTDFAMQFSRAIENSVEFAGFAAHMRETYFAHNMQAYAFIQILRAAVQLGYRMHAIELTESIAE